MIRESTSTYAKQATDSGITTEDKGKTLATLMNRAFAINYQCKAVMSDGTEQLREILETLVEKFDTPTAKTALDTVKMGRE